MEGSSEPQFDLSEYRVISIEDNHKIAIVDLLNNIISSEPLLEDLNDTKSVVWRLGSLINFFDESFISGQNELKIPPLEEMTETSLTQISSYIRHWLISYYNADSVIESLKLEDGIQEEISMAALLILNVFYQLRGSLPQVKTYFDLGWTYLSEFDDQLEAMWKTDRAVTLLQTELECERIQRLADKQKVTKLQKELTNIKTKLQQSKATVEKLKKYVEKPGPKSKKRGSAAIQHTPEVRKRGRPKKSGKVGIKLESTESDVEPDTPPPPGTPVHLSSSGTGSSCRYCGKWFNESIKLNRHMIIHAGSKPFACDWPGCGRPFDSNYKLQRHRRCHTGERPFACDICDKRFTRSDKLREHQRLHQRANNKKQEVKDKEKNDSNEDNKNNSQEVVANDTQAIDSIEGQETDEPIVA